MKSEFARTNAYISGAEGRSFPPHIEMVTFSLLLVFYNRITASFHPLFESRLIEETNLRNLDFGLFDTRREFWALPENTPKYLMTLVYSGYLQQPRS